MVYRLFSLAVCFVARVFLVEVVCSTTHWDSARKALLLVVLCVCVYVSKVVPVRLDFIPATHRAAFVTYGGDIKGSEELK